MATSSELVGDVVAPGDVICKLPESGELRIGTGVQLHGDHLCTVRSGILKQTKSGKFWVEGRQKRYIPAVEDVVVGTVVERHSENLIVDIGGPFHAVLPLLSFENATRRNKPPVYTGDVVYARVVAASRDMDPTLSCTDSAGRASGFGPLKGGLIVQVSTSLSRALLARPVHPVLEALGKSLKFELAVGLNARVWVNSEKPSHTVCIVKAITESEFLTTAQCQILVKSMLDNLDDR